MSLNIPAYRSPVQDLANSQPADLSALNSKGGKHQSSDSSLNEKGGSQLSELFSTLKSSQVDFGPKKTQNPHDDLNNSATKSSGSSGSNGQQDILDQLMKVIQTAVMQWLQNLMQPKDDSSGGAANSNKLATTGGGSAGNGPVAAGDVDSGGDGGGIEGAANTSGNQNAAQSPEDTGSSASPTQNLAATTPDSSVGASGDLNLPKELEPYRADIQDAAKATGMKPETIAGMIWAESRGKLDAGTTNVNGKADSGLMQVNADTFAGLKAANPKELGNANVNDAHDNIMAGALYLRDQMKTFGSEGAALRAYNSGPDKVNASNLADTGGVGGSSYPSDVLNFANIIKTGQGQLPG